MTGNPINLIDPLGLYPGGANFEDIPASPSAWNDGFGGIQLYDVVSPHLQDLDNVVALPPSPAEGDYQYVPYVQLQNGLPEVMYYIASNPLTHGAEWVITPEQLNFFGANEDYFHNYAAVMTPTGYQLDAARMGYDLMIGDYSGALDNCLASWRHALQSREWWIGTFTSFTAATLARNARLFTPVRSQLRFESTGSGHHLIRTTQVDGQAVRINSGHGYNRSHRTGDVRDTGLTMDQVDSAIAVDAVQFSRSGGNIPISTAPPHHVERVVNINGIDIGYRLNWLPDGTTLNIGTYFLP